jgi:membrane protein YqaA with SNARE-associated domain
MDAANDRREALKLGLKFLLGAAVLVGVVALVGTLFRPELESMGRGFVDHFGYAGIALGTFLADGLHCPVPPQFYMLAAIVSDWSPAGTILAVCVGSMAGGVTAYAIARHAQRVRVFARLLAHTRGKVDWLFARFGYWAVAIGSVTPIPYSFLCYIAGAYRMPRRIFVALSLFRIPKIILYFYLVELGWSAGG